MSKNNSDAESRRAHLYTLQGMCVLRKQHLSEGEFRKCLRMIHPKKGSPSGRNAYPVTEKMQAVCFSYSREIERVPIRTGEERLE